MDIGTVQYTLKDANWTDDVTSPASSHRPRDRLILETPSSSSARRRGRFGHPDIAQDRPPGPVSRTHPAEAGTKQDDRARWRRDDEAVSLVPSVVMKTASSGTGMTPSMEEGVDVPSSSSSDMIERTSLCLPNYETGLAVHRGEHPFLDQARRHFEPAENDAGERLMALKDRLRDASVTDFWRLLMEGMTTIADAQFAFVTKRILVDAQNSAVEMPPIGEPGSCLMAEAFFYNDGHGIADLSLQYSYAAYGTPCGHMKHDKVFLIPDRFNEFITNNPVNLPFPAEAYLALPLFVDGKCVAHFGIMWSPEGLHRRALSWGYLEMFMHALEDLILRRLVDGRSFDAPDQARTTPPRSAKVIPHDAILASQSLKPYARSLSHELRTPMQGVVGMLDVMQANIQESAAVPLTPHLQKIFASLREGSEVLEGGFWFFFSSPTDAPQSPQNPR